MIQIAFAGHNRPGDLGSPRRVARALAAAFEMIRTAGVGQALLLTGLAVGADRLAAKAWRDAGLGPIHAVFPFLDDGAASDVGPGRLAETATWLDGEAAQAQGRNPHLKQCRMVVEAADLVVVVWNGEPARGAGGTADAVLCALSLNLPVLWIQPSRAHPLRLIRPERLPFDFHFPEFQEALHQGRLDHVEIATPEALRTVFETSPRSVEGATDPVTPLSRTREFFHRTLWRTYAVFRRRLGGRVKSSSTEVEVPASLQAQPGFQMLSAALLGADHLANRLSAVHRSEQVLLVLTMITAAVVGSSSAIWPDLKVTSVWIELLLSVAALLVWATASGRRQHEHWSEQRRRAERLRLERAGWAIGIAVAGAMAGPPRLRGDAGRTDLRAAGLPTGAFDRARVESWGAWAMGELVHGQASYHRAVSTIEGRISHRIHRVEDVSFLFLFVIFTAYVVMHALFDDTHFPHWATGIVVMTGTVVPAVGAASIALEAKLEFQEQSARSRRLSATLEALGEELGPAPSLDALQDVGRMAMRVHLAEASRWQEGTIRRQLLRA